MMFNSSSHDSLEQGRPDIVQYIPDRSAYNLPRCTGYLYYTRNYYGQETSETQVYGSPNFTSASPQSEDFYDYASMPQVCYQRICSEGKHAEAQF